MAALLYSLLSPPSSVTAYAEIKPGETKLIDSGRVHRAVSNGQSVVVGVYDTANNIALVSNFATMADTEDLEARLREFSNRRTLHYGVINVCTVGGEKGQSEALIARIHQCLRNASLAARPHEFNETIGLQFDPRHPIFMPCKRT